MKKIFYFSHLEWEPHPYGGEKAKHFFANGYGISVITGKQWYSDGVHAHHGYELAVLDKDGNLLYGELTQGDVLGYLTKEEVVEVARQVAKLQPGSYPLVEEESSIEE